MIWTRKKRRYTQELGDFHLTPTYAHSILFKPLGVDTAPSIEQGPCQL
jgi:hypothetical protein